MNITLRSSSPITMTGVVGVTPVILLLPVTVSSVNVETDGPVINPVVCASGPTGFVGGGLRSAILVIGGGIIRRHRTE
jgi:hypothetical protein